MRKEYSITYLPGRTRFGNFEEVCTTDPITRYLLRMALERGDTKAAHSVLLSNKGERWNKYFPVIGYVFLARLTTTLNRVPDQDMVWITYTIEAMCEHQVDPATNRVVSSRHVDWDPFIFKPKLNIS